MVQEVSGRNIASARQYGDFEVLLPSNTNIMLSAAPSVRRMKKILQDYKEEDYLLLIGDLYNRGRYKILKWDRQEGLYYPVEIDLHQKGEL